MSWRKGNSAPSQITYKTPAHTIEYIYFELNHRWSHPEFWLHDQPFPAWTNWPIGLQERFHVAESLVGRETLVISMHSIQFRVSLENYTNKDWNKILNLLAPLGGSLRMFALSRNVKYQECYNRSTLAAAIGHLSPSTNIPSASHPHELYLAIDGQTIERSYYTDVKGARYPMQAINSNIYNPNNFYSYPRPASWPEEWLYPHAPNDPIRDPRSANYPLCTHCSLETRPKGFGPRCVCRTRAVFRSPLVEVIQYPSFPGSEGSLNRGVRLLENVSAGEILDEYLGEYIPLPTGSVMHDFGDIVYAFSCHGPPICANKDGESDEDGEEEEEEVEEVEEDGIWGNVEDIAGLIAGYQGNWTRFINHRDDDHSCRFESRVVAGKIRILVVARRDLYAGEQLSVNYGPNYFAE